MKTATSGPRQPRIPPEVPVKTKRLRWLLGVLGLVLVGGIGTVLARHWPYSEAQVVPGIQDTFKTTVTIGQYRRFYFPYPRCELKMVRLERPTKIGREKPLATVQKIRITGRYSDLLFRPYHLARIEVNGLRVRIPAPGEPKNCDGFLDALEANGKFEVKNGHFQKTLQVKMNVLSARALGKKIKAADDAPEVAVENLSSEVKIGNGMAHLTSTYFQVPGARARAEGTYNIENAQVDLRGNFWTDASLSDNTTGIKTILLEPLDPLFRRKHAGSMVGVSMEGDIHQPRIETVLTKKRAPWGERQQNSKIEITK